MIEEPAIRDDLARAHRAVLEHWAQPGGWWTGAERLAIVTESRTARAAAPLPPWVAPSTVDGLVPTGHPLPPAAIDAIWRLTNHPATLTAETYMATIERGLSPLHYVELVGIVATAAALDTFRTALGLPPYQLPAPAPGEPSGDTPTGLAVTTHWVPTIPAATVHVLTALSADAGGNEARARLATAQYVPAEALIGDLAWGRESLDRRQIELVAARTSALNECFY